MGATSIPVRLSLVESSAAALIEAARDLDAADNTAHFLAALENNHRLWRTLVDIASRNAWDCLDHRMAEFVTGTSRKAGRGVRDEQVSTLIDINHEVSVRLAGRHDVGSIHRRARLAWQESGRRNGQSLEAWLIAEIERKAAMH